MTQDGLAYAQEQVRIAEAVLAAAVVQARVHGASWAEVGERLGCSKQTAYNRYKDAATQLLTPPTKPHFTVSAPLPGQTSIEDTQTQERPIIDGDQLDAGTINIYGDPVNWTVPEFAPVCEACRQSTHYTEGPIHGFWFELGCIPTEADYIVTLNRRRESTPPPTSPNDAPARTKKAGLFR